MIDVLYYPDDITVMYSLFPLLTGKHAGEFTYYLDPEKALRSPNRWIMLFRMYKRKREGLDLDLLINKLHQSGKKVVYFDDTADPREVEPSMLRSCDLYLKKQLLVNRNDYLRPVYGKRIISEYYHEKHGIVDEEEDWAPPLGEADTGKLTLSWNLGIGSYPKSKIRKALSLRLANHAILKPARYLLNDPSSYGSYRKNKDKIASARFGSNFTRNTIAEHRNIFIAEIRKRPDLFLTGKISLKEYNREMKIAAATVSPFGWGEICFRDFEAIINRSVLIKPSMEHITTWPSMYLADTTYIPLDWDGKDLIDRTERLFQDSKTCERLCDNAYDLYSQALGSIDERVSTILNSMKV